MHEPTSATMMLPRSIPVAPGWLRNRFQHHPPTTAPTIPRSIVPRKPDGSSRVPGITNFARKPAIKPTTIHANRPITAPPLCQAAFAADSHILLLSLFGFDRYSIVRYSIVRYAAVDAVSFPV